MMQVEIIERKSTFKVPQESNLNLYVIATINYYNNMKPSYKGITIADNECRVEIKIDAIEPLINCLIHAKKWLENDKVE